MWCCSCIGRPINSQLLSWSKYTRLIYSAAHTVHNAPATQWIEKTTLWSVFDHKDERGEIIEPGLWTICSNICAFAMHNISVICHCVYMCVCVCICLNHWKELNFLLVFCLSCHLPFPTASRSFLFPIQYYSPSPPSITVVSEILHSTMYVFPLDIIVIIASAVFERHWWQTNKIYSKSIPILLRD